MDSTAPAFTVGQEVIVLPNHTWNNDRARARAAGHTAKVVKIGRTLAHVETPGGGTYRVDLVTGVERGEFPALVTTPEREAEHRERIELRAELSRAGVDVFRYPGLPSLALLRGIRDLVDAEARA